MIEQLSNSINTIVSQTQANFNMLIFIIAIPWLIFFLTKLSGNRLLLLGIIPRHAAGLPGIFFAPLLHSDTNHLFLNSLPLLVLSNFLLYNGLSYFLHVTLAITLLSGVLIWVLGRPGIHVGASALISGYWSLLVSNIYRQGTISAIILGLISLYYFAGIFFGIFPSKKSVSSEGHLFGILAGIAISYTPLI